MFCYIFYIRSLFGPIIWAVLVLSRTVSKSTLVHLHRAPVIISMIFPFSVSVFLFLNLVEFGFNINYLEKPKRILACGQNGPIKIKVYDVFSS